MLEKFQCRLTSEGRKYWPLSSVAVVLVVRVVGDVGNDARCGGGGGGVCWTTLALVGRKQQKMLSNRRELLALRLTTATHRHTHTYLYHIYTRSIKTNWYSHHQSATFHYLTVKLCQCPTNWAAGGSFGSSVNIRQLTYVRYCRSAIAQKLFSLVQQV